jgi:hypothetical protein
LFEVAKMKKIKPVSSLRLNAVPRAGPHGPRREAPI